jgi:hypothetical protein
VCYGWLVDSDVRGSVDELLDFHTYVVARNRALLAHEILPLRRMTQHSHRNPGDRRPGPESMRPFYCGSHGIRFSKNSRAKWGRRDA